MSQWDDDDEVEEEKSTKVTQTSFDDAGESLKNAEDDKRLGEMGDYDANPQYKAENIDRVREAIRKRTEDLGIKKSTVSAEAIQAAQERAQSAIANRGSGTQLDLSQIGNVAPKSDQDNKASMFFEPETEMSEEEMKEADPTGQLTFPEQVATEWGAASWPTLGAALKEVGLLIGVVALSAVIIVNWDNTLREFYTGLGFIPTKEEIMVGSEGMQLPEGWTENMSEDDFMNFQDEIGKTSPGSSSVTESFKSAFPDL